MAAENAQIKSEDTIPLGPAGQFAPDRVIVIIREPPPLSQQAQIEVSPKSGGSFVAEPSGPK